MSNTILSAKGVKVDFDLLRLKQQIGTAPKPMVVAAREDFVDNKFKRKINRQLSKVMEQESVDKSNEESFEESTTEEMPIVDEPTKEPVVIPDATISSINESIPTESKKKDSK